MRRRSRLSLSAFTSVALAGCLVACAPLGEGGARSVPSAPRSAQSEPSPAPTSTLRPEIRSGSIPAVEAPLPPERLRIPESDIDMSIVGVGVEPTGQMSLPIDPAVAGWYRYGPDADSTAGNVLLAAHVDAIDYPIGPLARLRDLAAGAIIEVDASDGQTRTYVLESITYYEKSALPTGDLFAREGPPALVIVTCGGPFDSATGHYRDNVVGVARPQ